VLCETIVALVGPILYDKHRQERSLALQFTQRCRGLSERLFGARHAGFKLATAISIAFAAVLFFVHGQYRITAEASLEGTVQRVVVAPVGGYIAAAPARAGDIVESGQVLARLEDKDLILERLKLASEQTQLQQEYREAMAQHDNARVSILRAQLDRASAQLALTEENLRRTQITAPLSGIVVSGDLSQSLGVPVERGDHLFEVAPLDSYRVMLKVDEREIGRLSPGQPGRLALVGFPGEYLDFTVARITPVSTAADGRNVFTVEAQLAQTPEVLRPGMQGVAKVDIGERRLAWIWFHRLVDWLRLWTWTWVPWS
jgi:RND family efflux transporter MFP subunit